MALDTEIEKRRADIHSDGYPMSIGELVSMYSAHEIDIHPEFQRYFRWSDTQKTRLIESLLLAIPIPSIFVAQRPDGVWDVIDGLQRLSTIFQFVGVLRGAGDEMIDPLVLTSTKYLPSLESKVWDTDDRNSIGRDLQLLIKRSKLDVKIILRESSETAKYELFQRLNTGGSQLTDQELRNVLLIMIDPTFYQWLENLSSFPPFIECIALSDQQVMEQYHVELVVRFLAFRSINVKELKRIGDIGAFLDDSALALAGDAKYNRDYEERIFKATFELLQRALSSESFRRFDQAGKRYLGGFSISIYEVLAFALGHALGTRNPQITEDAVRAVSQALPSDAEYIKYTGSGVRASSRIPVIVPLGREMLAKA
ncbi:MAG: DUF262 domain-containing protein [Chloroflexi bacterium]|nr:DUF262 domain-containing protein [Chloroflexota bacterium]